MSGMFSYDSKFMSILQAVTDAFILGILWLVCSVPVITMGAASTAFYYAYHKSVRRKMGYAGREFFSSFKGNFKQATKMWLIVLALGILILVNCYILVTYMQTVSAAGMLLGIMLALLLGFTMWVCFLFAYNARFEAGVKDALKNAAIMMLANFFWAILLAILLVAVIFMALRIPYVGVLAPTMYMYFANQILERVFSKYIKTDDICKERAVL